MVEEKRVGSSAFKDRVELERGGEHGQCIDNI